MCLVSFQSTRPLRGATRTARSASTRASYFNPRAPCGARRAVGGARWLHGQHFNPRAPCGARLPDDKDTCMVMEFQSTYPLRGATLQMRAEAEAEEISIHAPLAGCDAANATHIGIEMTISIHAPLAGCDQRIWREVEALSEFQSTHPLRGATCGSRSAATRLLLFQSTHPLRGATDEARAAVEAASISIHAPLAGCDAQAWYKLYTPRLFQSTHPLRGATTKPGGTSPL